MTPTTLLDLVAGAAGFSGLLAGASADRYLVQVPAWRRLDKMIWAEHSRHADLGNGRFWYPVLAFGTSGLSVLAAIGVCLSTDVVQGLTGPVYLAAVASVLGLGMTALAAPQLLRLREPRDLATTEASFRAFHGWGLIRAAFQILAFPINLWALYVLAARPPA
jgi:hypothetical protein